MAYNATYDDADVSPIIVDVGSKILVQIGAFAAIFGLVLTVVILVWLWKKK